jgi:hypothetical protein
MRHGREIVPVEVQSVPVDREDVPEGHGERNSEQNKAGDAVRKSDSSRRDCFFSFSFGKKKRSQLERRQRAPRGAGQDVRDARETPTVFFFFHGVLGDERFRYDSLCGAQERSVCLPRSCSRREWRA